MENSETRDFMNVDSFSQLPFIRPAPAKEKAVVRLFGIEVQNSASAAPNPEGTESNNTSEDNAKDVASTTTSDTQSNTNNNGDSGSTRKFECHYCCRNFPTSQALGGHQNAHKRERQHAKRAHLQSAMLGHPAASTDHHLYSGLLGYHHHRLGPTHLPYFPTNTSSSTTTFNTNHSSISSRYYPSTSYHHHHHHTSSSYPSHQNHPLPAPTINGSPLAMWRIPAAVHGHAAGSNRDRSLLQQQQYAGPPPSLPLIGNDISNMSQSSQYLLEAKKGLQDHVSLDLHL